MNRARHPKPLNIRARTKLQNIDHKTLPPSNMPSDDKLHTDMAENEQIFRDIFANCSDVVFRFIPAEGPAKLLVIYVEGLVNTNVLDESVLKPLIFQGIPHGLDEPLSIGEVLRNHSIAVAQTTTVTTVSEVVESVLQANVALIADNSDEVLIADLKGFEKRAIEEPSAEAAVRGPRVGFTETLLVNTSLLRQTIRSSRLKIEFRMLGDISRVNVALVYVEGVVPDSLLQEVRLRIDRIQTDAVLDTGYLEEFIEDAPFSPFPQLQNTERPDIVAASLLEGKVALFEDGSPSALIAPMTFWAGLQAAEDYYERFMYTTFVRWLRMILLNVSLFLPSFYVAVTSYQPQLIPTSLLLSIAAAREGVPFPSVVEAFLMEFMFEGLREAGVRLPKPIGSAVSIVGALVIGQAAVEAGIVSAPMVIIVATTGIASFSIPRYNFGTAYRMLRFPLLLLAGLFGLYGVAAGAIAILIHLVNLRSFGVPYLSPVAPQIVGDLKDVLIRAPRWSMRDRPPFLSGGDKRRIPEGQMPRPNRKGKKS